MESGIRRCVVWVAFGAFAFACEEANSASSVLSPLDTTNFAGEFAPNTIVDDASFVEDSLTSAEVQSLLQTTPYGAASFLATYSSHGLSAADAVVGAASAYHLNPLVILARAEQDQGLLSTATYPRSSPSRVEYAFGCGCARPGVCDVAWGGFDRQATCLAAAIRTSLDAIAGSGKTAGGWGPGIVQKTLDRQSVIPTNAATAALYQYDPVVGAGSREGAWLFWNIWQRYAGAAAELPVPTGDAGP